METLIEDVFWYRDDLDDGIRPATDPDLRGYADHLFAEMYSAIEKHGVTQTPFSPKMDPYEKFVIVVEEVGEMARAMTYDEGDEQKLMSELLQVAAMSSMWYMSMMEGVK